MSVLTADAGTSTASGASFSIPGSPASVRAAATRLVTRAGQLEDAAAGVGAVRFDAWTGGAADAGRATIDRQPGRLRDGGTTLRSAADALRAYADVLERAQATATRAAAAYERAEQLTRSSRAAYDADVARAHREAAGVRAAGGTVDLVIHPWQDPGEAGRQQALADVAQARADVLAAGDLAGVLLDLGSSVAPKVRELKDGYDQFKGASDPLLGLAGVHAGARQLRTLRLMTQQWRLAGDAALAARQVRSLQDALTDATALTNGAGSYAALREWMSGREKTSAADMDALHSRALWEAKRFDLLESVKLGSKFAKVTGVLGIVGGAFDIVDPSHEGWRGRGDQVAGVLSVGGGLAAVGATAGLITLGTVGAPVVAAALAAGAVWTVGNFVYDHWDDIEHGAGVAVDWVGDRAGEAWDGIQDGARAVEEWGDRKLDEVGDAMDRKVDDLLEVGGSAVESVKGWFD